MSFTYNLTTEIGKVRLFTGDKDSASYAFEDEEIQKFLELTNHNVYLASADMLRALASSEAKLVKKYKIGTKSVDKSGIIEALLKQAEALEERAMREPGAIIDSEIIFSEEVIPE